MLCHEVDFQRGGFGPRTIMLCDQCEREFHVGCLKKCGKAELQAIPDGELSVALRLRPRLTVPPAYRPSAAASVAAAAPRHPPSSPSALLPLLPLLPSLFIDSAPAAAAGEWHCSDECQRIRSLVNASVQAQVMEIPGFPNHTWQVRGARVGWTGAFEGDALPCLQSS